MSRDDRRKRNYTSEPTVEWIYEKCVNVQQNEDRKEVAMLIALCKSHRAQIWFVDAQKIYISVDTAMRQFLWKAQ